MSRGAEEAPDVTPEDTLARRLNACGAAAVYEALGGSGAVRSSISPLWIPVGIAGPAFTVAGEPNDNLALYRAVAEAPSGVVIVSEHANSSVAIWGSFFSSICRIKGIIGFVTDGLVRDTDRIRALAFPVFCTGTSILGPTKDRPGRLQVPITIGEAVVRPGDWIVGDGDGVVIVPSESVEEATIVAETHEREEAEIVRRIEVGETTIGKLVVASLPASDV